MHDLRRQIEQLINFNESNESINFIISGIYGYHGGYHGLASPYGLAGHAAIAPAVAYPRPLGKNLINFIYFVDSVEF